MNKVQRIKTIRESLNITLFEYRRNPKNNGNSLNPGYLRATRQFSKLLLIRNEVTKMASEKNIPPFNYLDDLTPYEFNPGVADSLTRYLDRLNKIYSKISNSANDIKDEFFKMNDIKLRMLENNYYNYKLEELVTKPYERKKILIHNNSIVQNTDPIYLDPENRGFLSFRSHFYAPCKYIFGIKTDTFIFNISLVLLSTILLFLALYFELLGRAIRFLEDFKFR